jgi:hypothetical protein
MAAPDKRESTSSVRLTREITVEVSVPDKALTPTVGVYAVPAHATSVTSITSNPHSDKTTVNPFDADIEALNSHNSLDKPFRKSVTLDAKANCTVWPGKEHWEKQAKQAKMKRSNTCSCMARLSPRNKIIVKLLIIVLVVGVAVSVGFGISKPLGAPIWGKKSD